MGNCQLHSVSLTTHFENYGSVYYDFFVRRWVEYLIVEVVLF